MKVKLIGVALVLLIVGWTSTLYSFGLGDIFKEVDKTRKQVEKATTPPSVPKVNVPKAPTAPKVPSIAPSSAAPATAPAKTGGGGLVGLGESFGLIDKRTANIARGATDTLQSLEPIGYDEERTLGSALALKALAKFGGAYHNPPLQKYITLVGASVASVSDRPDIPYYFSILNTEDPNAFAAPGGYIFVSRGLLRLVENEAQLAGVLGHEVAHVSEKHALETLQRGKTLQGVGKLSSAAMGKNSSQFGKLIDEISDTLFTKGLDKGLEYDADRLGMEYADRMGYYPGGLKDFMRILAISKPTRSLFLSTHPSPRDRYAKMKILLGKYQSASLNPKLTQRYKGLTQGKL